MFNDFTWDLGKEAINKVKHGVDFRTASRAFVDPHRLVYLDEKHSFDENRYFCIGKVRDKVLTVRFVYRENKVRILGAGYWRKGGRIYEKENNR